MGRYTRNRIIELVVLAIVVGAVGVLVVVARRGETLAEFLGKRGFTSAPCDESPFTELRDKMCYRNASGALLVLGSISQPGAGGRPLPRVTTYLGVARDGKKTVRAAGHTREAIATFLAGEGLAPAP